MAEKVFQVVPEVVAPVRRHIIMEFGGFANLRYVHQVVEDILDPILDVFFVLVRAHDLVDGVLDNFFALVFKEGIPEVLGHTTHRCFPRPTVLHHLA